MKHILTTSRFQLGRGALAGSGMTYGTSARCSCGDWKDRVNCAPSQGGSKTMKAHFEVDHLPTVTLERDVEILRERLAFAGEQLARWIREGHVTAMSTERAVLTVQQAHEDLVADEKALAASA